MRIQFVSGHGQMGGGEQMLMLIAVASVELGHQVVVIGPRWGELASNARELGLKYHALPGATRRSYFGYLAEHLLVRRGGLVWANGAMPALAATFTPDPLVVHLHQLQSPSQHRMLGLARRRARAVVVPSESMKRSVAGSVVLENWTRNLELRAPIQRRDEVVIGYVGRLSVDKGVDLLADALADVAASMPNRRIRLLIAGDSRFVSPEAAAVVEASLTRCPVEVVRLGWADPLEVYSQADICVVPSRCAETFGLVAAEAMAVGCPLVVSDAGALPEVVGVYYPLTFRSGDRLSLAEMIIRVISGDHVGQVPSLRERWRELFSPHAGRNRLEIVLRSVGD